jgi:transcription-repair coupling factor (superfamily II helicase)
MKAAIVKRSNVTVDDRRKMIVMARARKAADVLKVNQETFLRQQMKAMMGWAPTEPAPQSIKDAARDMAQAILKDAKAAALKQAAPATA